MIRRWKLLLVGALAVSVLALAACGGSSSDDEGGDSNPAEEQALAFFEAVDENDSAAVCSILSERFVNQNGTDRCGEMKQILGGEVALPEVSNSQLGDTESTVEVTVSGGDVYLLEMVNENDTWYVDQIGGEAQGKFF